MPIRFENNEAEPINVWLTIDGYHSDSGDFTLLWQTENLCTYGKSCHDGACVDARPCEGGWKIGAPSGSDRRSQVEVKSPWTTNPSQNVHEKFFTPERCMLEVQKMEPNANGATFKTDGRCYAEIDLEVHEDFPPQRDIGTVDEVDLAWPAGSFPPSACLSACLSVFVCQSTRCNAFLN